MAENDEEATEMNSTASDRTARGAATTEATIPNRTVHADDLLGDNGLLHIEHRGQLYTLRLTRNDKLILTK